MTVTEVLRQLAAGERVALVLFAVMAAQAIYQAGREHGWYERLKRLAWLLMCAAAALYSPAHIAWLVGRPAPKPVSAGTDALASGLACASFMALLAAYGVRRGLSAERVRRGALANALVFAGMVAATWATR